MTIDRDIESANISKHFNSYTGCTFGVSTKLAKATGDRKKAI